MEMNCNGSGSSGERNKGCSKKKGWSGKENEKERNCYGYGPRRGYVLITNIHELGLDLREVQEIGGVSHTLCPNSNRFLKQNPEKFLDGCDTVFMYFTAKLPNQDDADAIIFRAQLCKYNRDYVVEFIQPLTEEEAASKPLRDTSI